VIVVCTVRHNISFTVDILQFSAACYISLLYITFLCCILHFSAVYYISLLYITVLCCILQLLIQNLTDVNLRMDCVECLLVITQRHGNPTALSPLLSMFSEKSILTFSAVIQYV